MLQETSGQVKVTFELRVTIDIRAANALDITVWVCSQLHFQLASVTRATLRAASTLRRLRPLGWAMWPSGVVGPHQQARRHPHALGGSLTPGGSGLSGWGSGLFGGPWLQWGRG